MGSEVWLAWAAGLYEGEGSCSLIGRKRRPTPQLCLGSSDRDVIYKFHAVVGIGNVTGPVYRKERKPFWQWRGNGYEAVRFVLKQFGPYLGKRRTIRLREILAVEKRLPKKLSPGGHNRKLTIDQACEIRQRLDAGEQQTRLGKEFGITQAQVWRIKEGWTYVEGSNNHQRMVRAA